MKNHTASVFQPKNLADHRVVKIVNDNTVIVSSPDGKVKKCNVHHVKTITPTKAFTSALRNFRKVSQKRAKKLIQQKQSHYNLRSQSKEGEGTKY